MKKKILLIILSLFVFSQLGYSRGKVGWSIFRKLISPKVKASATTVSLGVRGDLSGVFYNPSVLGYNVNRELFLFSEIGKDSGTSGGFVYGHPLGKSSIAFGLAYYNAGKMTLSWLDHGVLKDETVTAQQDVLGLVSYGMQINNFVSVGATIKGATSQLFGRASAVAFAGDAGVAVSPHLGTLSLTASIQNVGFASKFVSTANKLPFSGYAAANYVFFINGLDKAYVAPGVDVTYLVDDQKFIPDVGLEIGYDPFSLSLGYQMNDENSFNIGAIYLRPKYDVAYSFVLGKYLNPAHRISIGYRF